MQAMVHVLAGELHAALRTVVRTPAGKAPGKRPLIVVLDYEAGRRELAIRDARYGMRRQAVSANGVWDEAVQMDGTKLLSLVAKYPAGEGIALVATAKDVAIVYGKSRIALPRSDHGRPPIRERPLKPNPRHSGKPYVPPDPVGKRLEWGETWLFSARMPIPHHRDRKK